MTCNAELSGWAGNILDSLGETGIATGSVVTWLKNNLGALNIAIEQAFWVSGVSGCIQPNMGQAESGIYTEMYMCHYFKKKASQMLGAMSYDQGTWLEIEGVEQGRIKRVSKNEVAKMYRQMYMDCKENIDKLVFWYKDHTNDISPLQITYNQRINVADSGLRCPHEKYPPANTYSTRNFIFSS